MHKKLIDKPLPIASEQIEPTMALILVHLMSRCEAARGDDCRLLYECNCLWEAARAIQMVAICVSGSGQSSNCPHFSIAASNEMGKAARYIEELTGIKPYEAWHK